MTKTNTNTNTNDTTNSNTELKYDPAKLEGASTSSKIRYLDKCGVTRGQIATLLGIRYQHVRNTLITPVTKPKNEIAFDSKLRK